MNDIERRVITEEIEHAQEIAGESGDAPNSYGHGYDTGYLDGLRFALGALGREEAT